MPASFAIQIAEWVAKAKGREKAFCVEFVQDIAEEVVRATPVKTGFLRSSWWGSIGQPETGKSGDPVAQMGLVAATLVPGEVYYAMNGAAYAKRVEYGFVGQDSLGRTYNQAPRAFVRGTVARAEEIAEAAAQRVAAMP
jgi:hypothetical protein